MNFEAKRNQVKRRREQTLKKNEESASRKRAKTGEAVEDVTLPKTENNDHAHLDDNNIIMEEANATKQVDEAKIEDETDEEDEEMTDATPHQDSANEKLLEVEKTDHSAVREDVSLNEQNEPQETAKQASETNLNLDSSNKGKVAKGASKATEVDEELLQAFRFFDRNRVGHIRVEDLRLIIHNLGKFLSHRDVKELVQSALLESNTGRDDRIFYNKLVNMADIQN